MRIDTSQKIIKSLHHQQEMKNDINFDHLTGGFIELENTKQSVINNHKQPNIQIQQYEENKCAAPEQNHIKQQPHQSAYKPQIDGLRTVAVMTVIIFHAWPDLLPGGYIGVDIFFVISGYLISQIILKQARKGKFSYIDFYSRRIRRIYPALTLVMLFVLFVAYERFIYYLQIQTYKKMAAATIFSANLESMTKQTGYFTPDEKNNPLLHLWSLGVQEQFYIVWPLVISLIVTRFSKKGLQILVIFTIMSFIVNVVTAYNFDSKIAFYFPLSRFWQMAVGGILAYQKIRISNKIIANILSTGAIIAVTLASFLMNQNCTFPGFWALIPTLSAAGIILAGQQSLFNQNILSSKPFVAIGKISYPLYLWHWPLLVFSKRFYPAGSSSIFASPLVAIMFAFNFSFLTYKLVQKPLRYRKGKIIVISLLIIMVTIGFTSVFLIRNLNEQSSVDQMLYKPGPDDYVVLNGKKHPNSSKNPKRLTLTRQKLSIAHWDLNKYPSKPIDITSKYFYDKPVSTLYKYSVLNEGQQNQLFVIGDSHAGLLDYRFHQLFDEQNKSSFPTVVNVFATGTLLSKVAHYNFVMEILKKHKPARVLFSNYWLFHLIDNKNLFEDMQDWKNTVKSVVDLGIEVFVAKIHRADSRINPNKLMDDDGPIQQNLKSYKMSEFRQEFKYLIEPFQKAVTEAGGKLFDFADNFCWEDTCEILLPSGVPLMADQNHYARYSVEFWLSSIDFAIQFPNKNLSKSPV